VVYYIYSERRSEVMELSELMHRRARKGYAARKKELVEQLGATEFGLWMQLLRHYQDLDHPDILALKKQRTELQEELISITYERKVKADE
jgi:hypothetical protein